MIIPLISIASCNGCQNRCQSCAHQGMRDDDPGYQMPLEDVDALIQRLRAVGSTVDLVSLCGPGEPLLWQHFNEAARLLAESKIVRRIEATTNGNALYRIAGDVWDILDPLYISGDGQPLDQLVLAKHAGRCVVRQRTDFMSVVESALPANARGTCGCPGSTYYKGRIYPHCGPVGFDAYRRAKVHPDQCSVALDEYDPRHLPPMPLPCEWCWGNPLTPKIHAPHQFKEERQ